MAKAADTLAHPHRASFVAAIALLATVGSAAPARAEWFITPFLGVKFDVAIVARVRIVCGNGMLAAGTNDLSDGGNVDLVVVDNFIYGEPQPVAATNLASR